MPAAHRSPPGQAPVSAPRGKRSTRLRGGSRRDAALSRSWQDDGRDQMIIVPTRRVNVHQVLNPLDESAVRSVARRVGTIEAIEDCLCLRGDHHAARSKGKTFRLPMRGPYAAGFPGAAESGRDRSDGEAFDRFRATGAEGTGVRARVKRLGASGHRAGGLLNQVVRPRQHRWWNGEAEVFRSTRTVSSRSASRAVPGIVPCRVPARSACVRLSRRRSLKRRRGFLP